jgi:hypothetical protein
MTNTNEIQSIIRGYFKNLHSIKVDNLEMDKFLDTYNWPKLNKEGINELSRSITSNEIEAVIKCFQTKSPGPDGFTVKF